MKRNTSIIKATRRQLDVYRNEFIESILYKLFGPPDDPHDEWPI